jgi:hypothetical protein
MKMLTTALAASIGLSGPATAQTPQAATPVTFTHAGITYDYVVTTDQQGRREIVGTDSRGERFRLRVVGRSVSGRYGYDEVWFDLDSAGRPVTMSTSTR